MKQVEAASVCCVMALAWLYLAADLVQISQGLDGTLYAALAKFLAAGQGNFWALPHFEANQAGFYDHPPLGIWLQGIWFALWGDAFWVEKAYSGLLLLLMCVLIVRLWRLASPQSEAWWPLMLFLCMPVVTLATKNNVLESLVTVIALAAAWLSWHAYQRVWLAVVVGLLTLAAVLVKGPAALFMLVIPACFAWFLHRDGGRALWLTGCTSATFCIAGLGLLQFPAAAETLGLYFSNQVVASLSGVRIIEHGRGWQVGRLAYNLGVVSLLLGLAYWRTRRLQPSPVVWSMLLIGLCASLPLLISPRQYQHYLLPSLPFFALAAARWVGAPRLRLRARTLWWAVIVCVTLGGLRAFLYFGDDGDHRRVLADVRQIGEFAQMATPAARAVRFCDESLRRRVYLARHFGVRSHVSDAADELYTVCTSPPAAQSATAAAPDARLRLASGWQVYDRP